MKIVNSIKDPKQIASMKSVLKKRGLRDLLLFVMGINTALRVSDLLSLIVGDVRDSDGQFRPFVLLKETKTRKMKRFPLNEAILEVLKGYIGPAMQDSEPLFASLSREKGTRGKKPISRVQAYRILNGAAQKVGIEEAIGTHSLRKTFGYHTYKKTGNLALVQKLLNHASSGDTLRYIGIDQEDMDDAYLALNL